MLGQRVEPAVDLLDHAHHVPRRQLRALLVLGKVKLPERLAFLPDVTELAAHTEGAGEVAHDPDDVHDGRVFRNDLNVDERVRREMAGRLRRQGGRDGQGGKAKNHGV